MSIIRLQTCVSCKHSAEFAGPPQPGGAKPLECRRYPPQVTVILVPIAKDKLVAQAHAAAPGVQPDFHCGEWGTKFAQPAGPLQMAA